MSLAEQLENAIYSGDLMRVRELTDGLSETERAPLRKALEKSLRSLVTDLVGSAEGRDDPKDPQRLANFRKATSRVDPTGARRTRSISAGRLALVAIGARTQAEWALVTLRRRWSVHDYPRAGHEPFSYHAAWVLVFRPVDWVSTLLPEAFTVDEDSAWDTEGPLKAGKDLHRAGKVSSVVLLPAISRTARRHGIWRLDWNDDFWRDVVLACLEARDDPPLSSATFPDELKAKFRTHTLDGRIPRGPLLDLALQRFAEIPKKHDANWWGQLIDTLAPTSEEWSERSDAVLDLLGAPTSRAAGVGIDAAKKLLASGAVPPDALVPALQPALGSEAIGVSKGAVDLLRACAKKEPSLLGEALTAALQGLSHPKTAVSGAVLSWLEQQSGWRDDPALIDEVALAATGMPEAIAVRLRALLPEDSLMDAAPLRADALECDPSAVLAQVRSRLAIEQVPEWRTFLADCEAALLGQSPLPPPPPRDTESWRNGPLYEVPKTAEETARLLLASNLIWTRGVILEALLAGMRLPVSPQEGRLLSRMLAQAIPEQVTPLPEPWSWTAFWQLAAQNRYADPFTVHLLESNLAAIAHGETRPPLSLPTHLNGLLDPEVFADRLQRVWEWRDRDLLELSSALYRMAPGSRARNAAWARLEPLLGRWPAPVAASLRIAFGPESGVDAAGKELIGWAAKKGFDPVNPKKVTPLRLVCAASRCRYPLQAAPFLQSAQQGAALRRLLSPTKSRLIDTLIAHGELALPYAMPKEPQQHSFLGSILDTVRTGLGVTAEVIQQTTSWTAEWHAWGTLPVAFPELAPLHPWPQSALAENAAFAFPAGIGQLLPGFVKRRDKIWDVGAFVEALRVSAQPHVDLRPLLPTLGTLVNDEKREVREAAIALLQVAHRDGRLFTDEVVAFLAGALTGMDARPRTLMPALATAAALDDTFRDAASIAVESLIASTAHGEGSPTGAERVALLEPLHAWRAAAGRGIEDPTARAALETMAAAKSKTRTRELAQLLLRLSTPSGRPSLSASLTARDVSQALGLGET